MTMRRQWLSVLTTFAVVHPTVIRAQALDSVTVGLDSRFRWRGYDLGDGALLRTSLSFAVGGFSTSQAPGDRNDWRIDGSGWTPITNRSLRPGDQYEASLHYGRCLSACRQLEWNKRVTLNVAANEYWLPKAAGDRTTAEIEATLRGYLAIQKIGSTQVGGNLYPYLTVDHDVERYRGTYVRAGAGTYVGPVGPFGILVDAAVSASDWPRINTTSRSFGYHGVDAQLGIDYDKSVWDRHLSTRLTWGVELPSNSIAATHVGVLGLRFKLYGPALML